MPRIGRMDLITDALGCLSCPWCVGCRHLPAPAEPLLRMSRHKNEIDALSRRSLLKTMGLAPLFSVPHPSMDRRLGLGPRFGFLPIRTTESAFPFSDVRLSPTIRRALPWKMSSVWSLPGSDEYVTEKYAFEIEVLLQQWGQDTQGIGSDFSALAESLDPVDRSLPPGSGQRKSRCAPGNGIDCEEDALAARWLPGGSDFSSRSGPGWDRSPGWRPRNFKSPVSKKSPAPR